MTNSLLAPGTTAVVPDVNPFTLVWNLVSCPFRRPRDRKGPGATWSSRDVPRALRDGVLRSRADAGDRVRLSFRNASDRPLALFWSTHEGVCHRLCPLPALGRAHAELAHVGHTFLVVDDHRDHYAHHFDDHHHDDDDDGPLELDRVVGAYRPEESCDGDDDDGGGGGGVVHAVTVLRERRRGLACCAPGDDERPSLVVRARRSRPSRDDLLDTRRRPYEDVGTSLGGWPCRAEPDWHDGDERTRRIVDEDLARAAGSLPRRARESLARDTLVWIDRDFVYGPRQCPARPTAGLCYHPSAEWLERNKLHAEKRGCVEMYRAREYVEKDRKLWGRGGLLLHELCHAYHHKCLENGYDNEDVAECYRLAMKERLYDWVRVKGPQGPMARAYACTDPQEYFAELSTAFLGQPDLSSDEEYNKWYPFNRRQVQEHDPRAYEMLKRLWKVAEYGDDTAYEMLKRKFWNQHSITNSKREQKVFEANEEKKEEHKAEEQEAAFFNADYAKITKEEKKEESEKEAREEFKESKVEREKTRTKTKRRSIAMREEEAKELVESRSPLYDDDSGNNKVVADELVGFREESRRFVERRRVDPKARNDVVSPRDDDTMSTLGRGFAGRWEYGQSVDMFML